MGHVIECADCRCQIGGYAFEEEFPLCSSCHELDKQDAKRMRLLVSTPKFLTANDDTVTMVVQEPMRPRRVLVSMVDMKALSKFKAPFALRRATSNVPIPVHADGTIEVSVEFAVGEHVRVTVDVPEGIEAACSVTILGVG